MEALSIFVMLSKTTSTLPSRAQTRTVCSLSAEKSLTSVPVATVESVPPLHSESVTVFAVKSTPTLA